jgi:hypothetical protein
VGIPIWNWIASLSSHALPSLLDVSVSINDELLGKFEVFGEIIILFHNLSKLAFFHTTLSFWRSKMVDC